MIHNKHIRSSRLSDVYQTTNVDRCTHSDLACSVMKMCCKCHVRLSLSPDILKSTYKL